MQQDFRLLDTVYTIASLNECHTLYKLIAESRLLNTIEMTTSVQLYRVNRRVIRIFAIIYKLLKGRKFFKRHR